METKIKIINIPALNNAHIQRSYVFDNDFRFEVGDELNINCIIEAYIPTGELKVTECGTSQQIECKHINKDCYLSTKIIDINYHINNNGVVHRVINVEMLKSDKDLLKSYVNSEILSQTIDFE